MLPEAEIQWSQAASYLFCSLVLPSPLNTGQVEAAQSSPTAESRAVSCPGQPELSVCPGQPELR